MSERASIPTRPGTAVQEMPSSATERRGESLLWVGLVLGLTPLLLRATSNLDTLPGWDLDPYSSPHFRNGLSPADSMMCDVAALLGAAVLFLFVRSRRLAVSVPMLLLGSAGSVAVLAHAFFLPTGPGSYGSIGDGRIGLSWLSAIWMAVAALHISPDSRAKRVLVATLLGFVAILVLRGAHEFFIDHPRTVQQFLSERSRIFASHGWSDDSSMAKAFERRLMQSDVSGWFGLSNVYAGICAAMATAFVGMFVAGVRRDSAGRAIDRRGLFFLAAGAVSALGSIAMSQSKGGVIALISGLAAFIVLDRLRAWRTRLGASRAATIGGVLGISAIAGALGLIWLRGLIGERIGELSVFFRYFYAQAAFRIFGSHPLWGVGPDGFQQAYTTAKNPISPEEVSSPHIVVLDWLGTLGVFGVAWVVLLVGWAWRAGHGAVALDGNESGTGSRNETRAALAVVAFTTLAGSYVQGTLVTPDLALLRASGLIAWGVMVWGLLAALRAGVSARTGLAAGALAILAHGQIDVELSWTQACGIGLMLIALAAGGAAPARRVSGRAALAAALLMTIVAGLCVPVGVLKARRWEQTLLAGAERVRPIAEIEERLNALAESKSSGKPNADSVDRIIADLSTALGRTVRSTPEDLRRARVELDIALTPAAIEQLVKAYAIDPTQTSLIRDASRLMVREADANRLLGRSEQSRANLDSAVRLLQSTISGGAGQTSTLETALAQVLVHRWEVAKNPNDLRAAGEAYDRAIAIERYNLDLARQRYRVAVQAHDTAATRSWAAKCLELDELMRLDRAVRGLSDEERKDLLRSVKTP